MEARYYKQALIAGKMDRMLLRDNCVVMQFHSDLTNAKEMVKNLTT